MIATHRRLTLRILVSVFLSLCFCLTTFAQSSQSIQSEGLPSVDPSFRVMTHPVEHRLQRGRPFNGDVRTLPQIAPKKFERPEFEEPEITPVPYPGTAAPPQTSTSLVTSGGPTMNPPAPSASNSFEGLDFTNWGAGHPPDTNGDVGPTDYVQTINTSVGIYRKSDGVRLAAFTFNTLMSQGNFGNLCDTNNFGDPVVVYDTFEDRWIITDFAFILSGGNIVAPAFQCFAVSKSGDPVAGGWNFYSIRVNDAFPDYPKFGIWSDGLYMSANMFGFGAGGAFHNVRVWAFNKAQMYAGAPSVQILSFDAPAAEFTLLPSNARLQTGTPPTGSPNYFAVVAQFLNVVSVYKFHVDWNHISTSTFSGPFQSLTATSWSQLLAANRTEQSPGNKLDTLYFRLMVQNQYTNIGGAESLWNSHTVGASGATSAQSAPRFYQVDVTGGTVAANATQAFTYSPDATVFRFMPSVEVDRAGDMAMGYSATNATLNPAIRYAGRLAGDAVNSITQTETSLIEGTGTQSGNCGSSSCTRWGDYSAMTLDPDGCTFWYTNMYYQTTGLAFNTRIGAFSFPSCTPVATGTLQGTVTASGSGTPISGATVALGSRTTTTAVDGTYSFTSLPSGTYPSITASFPGFNSSTATNIVISDGLTTTQDFSLALAPTSGCLVDTTQADFQAGVPTNCDLTSSPGDVILLNAPSIDQQNTTLGNNGVGITITTFGGQTFTPAVTGQLTRADINLFCSGCTGTTPNLTLSLRATSGGLPTGADLASATITGFSSGAAVFYTANFSSPPTLTAGTQYALVIRPTVNPSPGTYALTRSGTSTLGADVYAGGTRVSGATSGTVWSIPTTGGVTTDAGFKVFMQTGFAPSGTFVSSIKDANPSAGATATWGTLSWNAATPTNTNIQFQAAASNSISGPFSFVGPDGTAGTFFTNGGSLAQFNGNRYLKYQASLTTTDSTVTPTLNDVTACFSTISGFAPPTIAKAFGASTIPLTGTTSLRFTIDNPNASASLSGIGFSDTLPAGLVVANPNGLTGSCGGGTITAAAGSNSISLSGAALAATGGCSFAVNVTGISAGIQNNTTGTITSNESGAGSTASASLTVNQASTSTTVASSSNPSVFGQSVTFTATVSSGAGTPTGTVTFLDGGSPIGTGTLSGGVATFTTSALAVGSHVITTSYGGDANFTGSTGSLNTNPQVVIAPPTISKVFGAASIPLNGTTSLSFTINNPNTSTALTGVGFGDTLPAGLVVANPNNLTGSCGGGTITAVAGTNSISLSGATLAASSGCTFSVNVTGVTAGNQNNTTGNVTSTEGGAGGTASASITVVAPPSIAKAFNPATIALNATTSLTFTITNPGANTVPLTGVAFTDTLPTGLTVADSSASACGGTLTTTNPTGIALAGATIDANSQCQFSMTVTGAAAGIYSNTTGNVTSTNGGTGNTASSSLTVAAPPTISKTFGVPTIPLNGTTSLSFTINNPNTSTLTGVGFSDTLPAGLLVANPNNLTGSCGEGTITAVAGTNSISLSGATLTASSGCTFSVDVTGTSAGVQNNTTGNVTSTEGGAGGTASASITVVAPPSIAKAFNPVTIALNTTTSLTFTITNPGANTVPLTGVAFTDTLPIGLTVANSSATTCGGTLTTTSPTGIALTGATINTNSQCQFSVTVTGAAAGNYSNTTGNVTSTNGGTGNTASSSLTVAAPPTIAKSFGALTIPLNGTTSLSFTITNPNTGVALNGVSFTDSLPAGLVVATPGNLNNTCGGGATAVDGSGSVNLTGVTLAASASCTLSVNVTGTTAGVKNNSVTVTSTEGGTGNTSNVSITVVAPPTISNAFAVGSIPLSGTTTLTFTVNNPNTSTTLTGVAFSDTLPSATGTLVVANTPNVSNTCGGSVTATAGTNLISLSGGSVNQSASCTLSVDVRGTVAGDANNTTGAITSTEGGTGATSNTATLSVVAPPTIQKAFGAANLPLNGTTTLTFTIGNPAANTTAESGVAFTDTLTNGLQVAGTPGVSNTCGGAVTAAAGSTSISLTGGSIATPGTSCTIAVNVTGTQTGIIPNTTGAVSSTNGGTGAASNTATLTVASPPTITKAFNPTSIALNSSSTLSFTINNPNTNVALSGVAFGDVLPAGLVVAATPNVTGSCGSGTITAAAGSGTVSLAGGTLTASPGAGSSCTFSVSVTGTTAGVKNNSVVVTSTEGGTGNTANASVTVVAPPTISKAFTPASVPLNSSSSLSFTITNPNTASALSGVGFSDNLPAGVVVAATPNLTGSCGSGTITATAGSGTISLAGGTLTASPAAGSSCTFSVNVTGTTAGSKSNTTGAVTSTEGGTGATSNTAVLTVVAAPSIAKAFNPAAIGLNATTSLTFTITNPAANTAVLTGVGFSDTLPAGLTVANSSSSTCGGTLTTTAPTGIVLSGASVAVNSQCVFSVTVTGAASGKYTNTTGPVSSSNGGTGNTASANLSVAALPSITKFFGVQRIALNGNTSMTLTIGNSNAFALTGIAVSDNFPAGLVVNTPPGVVNNCGGTFTAVAGSGSVSLSGVSLAGASTTCDVTVLVQGTTPGLKVNTTGAISSNESGPGGTATDSLNVLIPPTLAKAFGAATVAVGANTSLTFTINNPNGVNLDNLGFTDNLPAGLVIATPNGLAGTCLAAAGPVLNPGVASATSGTGNINLSSLTLANGSCSFSINITGTTTGNKVNTTSTITGTFDDGSGTFIGITGGTATASIAVLGPPSIAKAFGATSVPLSGTTSLTFTITNPGINLAALSGVAFTDNLPAGIVVATPNGLVNNCGGTATAVAGSGSVSLTGAGIATSSNCTLIVNVTGTTNGTKNNITGAVTATNGGTGNTASASIVVGPAADISVTLTHAPDPAAIGGKLKFVATVTNNGPDTANVTLTESFTGKQYLVSAIASVGTCGATEPVSCTLSGMGNGETRQVTIIVTPLLGRNVTANVTVAPDAGTPDPNNGNNSATSTARIRFKPQKF